MKFTKSRDEDFGRMASKIKMISGEDFRKKKKVKFQTTTRQREKKKMVTHDTRGEINQSQKRENRKD